MARALPRFLGLCFLLGGLSTASRLPAQTCYFPPLTGSSWETVDPLALGWDTSALAPLAAYLHTNNSRAFLILKDGRIAVEWYFNGAGPDSVWYWASAGKTLTALLVGIARRQGYLALQDTTARWLGPGWTSAPPAQESLITVRHQLTMTSGLDDDVPDPYCTDPLCLLYRANAGTRWAYHNAPYTLLDRVMASATGLTLNQFFVSRVRSLTGITGVFLPSGYNNVFFSVPRSMARFGLLMLNRGRWGTTDVLGDSVYFEEMISTSQPLNLSYGYLWWLNGKASYRLPQSQLVFPGPIAPSAPPDMFSGLGKNGQFVNVVPGMGVVMVRMGEAPDSSLVPFQLNDQIWERLRPVMRRTVPVPVVEGWNLVSVPVQADDSSAGALFPGAVGALFGFDSAYTERPVLRTGEGYWAKFTAAGTAPLTGWPLSLDTLRLAGGWNLVGSIADTVDAAGVRTLPPGILSTGFYTFGPSGYEPVTRLLPGRGYWVKSAGAGGMILSDV